MIRRGLVIATAIACGASAAAWPQVRDGAPAVSGTASIAGVVLMNGVAGQSARRVRVTLNDVTHTLPGHTTTTDDRGAFVFRGIPAGRFELQAFRNGYLRASYGAARPDRAGTPIVVKDGDAIANLTIGMARGGVITGVVRDMRSRPLPGLTVKVLKLAYNAVSGEPTLVAPGTSVVSPTDDRGEYRAFGLPPGAYLVLVNPPPSGGRSGVADDLRQLTTDDVRQALQGRSTNTRSPARVNFAPVFHPGVTDIAAAATVVVGLSEERTGIDMIMQLVSTATVSGRVDSPTGALPSQLFVALLPQGARAEMQLAAGLRSPSTVPRPDGTFVIGGVAPGTYTVRASTGSGRGAPRPGPMLSAATDISVNGEDVDVPLALQTGVPVSGRVAFQGARPAAAELQTLTFGLVPASSAGTGPVGGPARVDAEGRFTFASVAPDIYRFTDTWTDAAARNRWTIASAVANGRDVLESPMRIAVGDTLDWVVTYTDAPSQLIGTLQDARGRAATDYFVLVFPADRRFWTPGSRRIRMTRPATDGTFSVTGLPPGEYLLAALADLEPGEWNDPTLLAQLAPSSLAITLRAGTTTTQEVRIGEK